MPLLHAQQHHHTDLALPLASVTKLVHPCPLAKPALTIYLLDEILSTHQGLLSVWFNSYLLPEVKVAFPADAVAALEDHLYI